MAYSTNLLVKTFKSPDTLTHVIYFIPPPQTNKNTATHILDYPKIKSSKENSYHEDDDKVINKEGKQNVKCQGCSLPDTQNNNNNNIDNFNKQTQLT